MSFSSYYTAKCFVIRFSDGLSRIAWQVYNSTCIAMLKQGFSHVKTWLLITRSTAFYAIIRQGITALHLTSITQCWLLPSLLSSWRNLPLEDVILSRYIALQYYEPRHDKTNKMSVRPAKTQISLGIRPVWSESSLCTQWEAKDPVFLHADWEDSDQTGWMPRLIWVFAGRTLTLLVLSCRGSYSLFKCRLLSKTLTALK